jgi:hypothetical protein
VNPAVFAAAASALVHVASGAAFAPAFRPLHGCVPPAAVVTFCGRARTGPSKIVPFAPSTRRRTSAVLFSSVACADATSARRRTAKWTKDRITGREGRRVSTARAGASTKYQIRPSFQQSLTRKPCLGHARAVHDGRGRRLGEIERRQVKCGVVPLCCPKSFMFLGLL